MPVQALILSTTSGVQNVNKQQQQDIFAMSSQDKSQIEQPQAENEVLIINKEEKAIIVSFDDLLKIIGEFGRYQKRIYFLLFLPTIFSAMHKLAWVFLGAQVDHRCLLPWEQGLDNVTYQDTHPGKTTVCCRKTCIKLISFSCFFEAI